MISLLMLRIYKSPSYMDKEAAVLLCTSQLNISANLTEILSIFFHR